MYAFDTKEIIMKKTLKAKCGAAVIYSLINAIHFQSVYLFTPELGCLACCQLLLVGSVSVVLNL